MDDQSFNDVLGGSRNLEDIVKQYNASYEQAGKSREFGRMKDMDDETYEEVVIDLLIDAADTPEMALKVFNHPDLYGGWMTGDVEARLKAML